MKEFKGTPGEWVATQYGYEKWSVNGDKGQEVCSTWRGDNAYLIAAAPELLEALQAIMGAITRCEEEDSASLVDEFTEDMELAARAAIAKALGETQ